MTTLDASPAHLTRSDPEVVEVERRRWTYRHPWVTRATHWINALCFVLLAMSGLQIFNAHPALYWGQASRFDHPWLAMMAESATAEATTPGATGGQDSQDAGQGGDQSDDPDAPQRGITTLGTHRFDTTGVLGLSADAAGQPAERGFPSWATIPSEQDLATGRRWHFFFAWVLVLNGLVYLAYMAATRRLGGRVIPARDQWQHIGRTAWEHLTLRFPRGDEAKRYNVLQKLTYLVVLFVLFPVQILAGLAMSPAMDAVAHPLLEVFGGRQSARSVHFIVASLLVLFLMVHVALVVLSGPWNNLRGMLTGWYVIERKRRTGDAA